MRARVLLIILDGWGLRSEREGNAIELAGTPYWHSLLKRCPNTSLVASGTSVGLRPGLMGNSEVGHMTLGAGRVIWQDITRIDRSIADGSFFRHPLLLDLVSHLRASQGALHLLGLVSDGGVHSAIEHLTALLEFVHRHQVRVKLHALTDGRDTAPMTGVGFVRTVQETMTRLGVGHVATLMGRYWAMDRDRRWDRTARAYHAITLGEGRPASDPLEAVREAYAAHQTDEFIEPFVFEDGRLLDGDALFCFNFRADRMRQIVEAFAFDAFQGFDRKARPRVRVGTMTRYREDWQLPMVFSPEDHRHILGEVLAQQGFRQLRIAETEKYAHVTFFFNAGRDAPFEGEERILVPSPKVATYDLMPEMSAPEVTQRVLEAIRSNRFGAIVLNYANPDMVGHSGNLEATIRACEVVDEALRKVVGEAERSDWTVFITGDHGNCEEMVPSTAEGGHTYHTTNPVPLVLVSRASPSVQLRSGGSFQDVAPSILEAMGIAKPAEMTGESLLE